ncbi:VanZ family protein [Fictibacillus nanhaiensis]|uniref:VanZ family protein n=1 Tax=Fictibacillus nanhaiensis TaxID=742169 RepID=UPI001C98B988|nr:VanZ family protein [Fictibacillus nanhaiensis]
MLTISLSLAFIYLLTVFPFPFFNPYAGFEMVVKHNVVPLDSIRGSLNHFYYMVPLRNIGGNIILFIPLGFALLFRFHTITGWRAVGIGFVVSLMVETCQLFMGYRSFDVDDLILNTTGTGIGAFTFTLTSKLTKKETFSLFVRKIG